MTERGGDLTRPPTRNELHGTEEDELNELHWP